MDIKSNKIDKPHTDWIDDTVVCLSVGLQELSYSAQNRNKRNHDGSHAALIRSRHIALPYTEYV